MRSRCLPSGCSRPMLLLRRLRRLRRCRPSLFEPPSSRQQGTIYQGEIGRSRVERDQPICSSTRTAVTSSPATTNPRRRASIWNLCLRCAKEVTIQRPSPTEFQYLGNASAGNVKWSKKGGKSSTIGSYFETLKKGYSWRGAYRLLSPAESKQAKAYLHGKNVVDVAECVKYHGTWGADAGWYCEGKFLGIPWFL